MKKTPTIMMGEKRIEAPEFITKIEVNRGELIAALHELKNLNNFSQTKLAEVLNVSQSTVSNLLSFKESAIIPIEALKLLANYGYNVWEFFY